MQPQWQEELREKFNLHFWSFTQNWHWNTHNLTLASSHLVRRTSRMQELLAAEPWDLIVLSEAHHARRRSPTERKETPNKLLELMQQLKEKTKALILLTATPMQIDCIQKMENRD